MKTCQSILQHLQCLIGMHQILCKIQEIQDSMYSPNQMHIRTTPSEWNIDNKSKQYVAHLVVFLASYTRERTDALCKVVDIVIWWHATTSHIDFCTSTSPGNPADDMFNNTLI